MFFRQIKEVGDNFSYLIADESSREAAVVDPSRNGKEIERLVRENGFVLKFIIVTHHHHDHLGDSYLLKSSLGGLIVVSTSSSITRDLSVADDDTLNIGQVRFGFILTPGHTPDSMCVLVEGRLMTGDTLFIGECGRTDLPGGDPSKMYDSLFCKLGRLDGKIAVYPGHDYGPTPYSTLDEQRRTNYTLKERTLEEFVRFMAEP